MSSQRLFAAVLPPEPAADELAGAVAPLHELPGAVNLRWTARAGWHYTLAFLGNVDEELLPALHTRLERAAHRTEPFPLRIRGGGRFDGRVLWAGAEGGLGTLRLLAERAAAAARRSAAAARRSSRRAASSEAEIAPISASRPRCCSPARCAAPAA